MKKAILKKLLCSLVITLMIGTSIPAQAGNVSNPTSNGKSGTSGGGAGLTGGANGVAVFHTHSANAYHGTCPYHSHSGNSNSGGGCYGEKHQSSHTVHWTDSMCCSNCQEGPHAHFPGNPYGACGSFNPNWERTETETWYTVNCGISQGYLCGKTAGVTIDGSSKSYGGNSNLSTTDTLTDNRISFIGSQTGNGVFHLKVVNGNVLNGLENNTYLNNTVVRDKSNPNSVGEISYQDLKNQRIVEWEIADSNGTEYEFKAQTYKINFDSQNGTDLIMDTEFN